MKFSSKLSSIFVLFVFFAGFVLASPPHVYHQHEDDGNVSMQAGRVAERNKHDLAGQSVAAQGRADAAMTRAGNSQQRADAAHAVHDHDGANYHFGRATHHMNTASQEQQTAIDKAGDAAEAGATARGHYRDAQASYKAAADGRMEHTRWLQSQGVVTNGNHAPATAIVRGKEINARLAKERN